MTNQPAAIDVVVRDGSTVCLRPAEAEDSAAILQFFRSLSSASLYDRFLGLSDLSQSRITGIIEPRDGMPASLVAEVAGRIVAFAGFHPSGGDRRCSEATAARRSLTKPFCATCCCACRR